MGNDFKNESALKAIALRSKGKNNDIFIHMSLDIFIVAECTNNIHLSDNLWIVCL